MGAEYTLYAQPKGSEGWEESADNQLCLELGKAYNHSVTAEKVAYRNGNRGTPRIIQVSEEDASKIIDELSEATTWSRKEELNSFKTKWPGECRYLITIT